MFDVFLSGFSEIGSIATFATFSITVLGAVSLFIANMGRYFQAKKFGIPIKAVHQANIGESADLWVALVGALGFGVFVPVVLLGTEIYIWFMLAIAFVSFALGLLCTKNNARIAFDREVKKDGVTKTVNVDHTLHVIAVLALLATLAYFRLSGEYYHVFVAQNGRQGGILANLLLIVSVLVMGLYMLVLLYMLTGGVRARMFGSGDIMTTEIDKKTYIVAMRHNQYNWILLPCEIEDYHVEKVINKKTDFTIRTGVKRAIFVRGVFIMKDLSELPEPIVYRTSFQVMEKE